MPGRFQHKKIAYMGFRAKFGRLARARAGEGGVVFGKWGCGDGVHFQEKKVAYMNLEGDSPSLLRDRRGVSLC